MRMPHPIRALFTPNIGHVALLAALALTMIGLDAMNLVRPAAAAKQLQFVPIALVGMVIAALIHPKRLVDLAYPLLGLTIVMLVILLIPGMPESIVPVRNGARRWFDLQIALAQPSELAKIAYVLSLATWLRFRENYRTFRGLLVPLLLTFVPMGLILVEPDLGTATIFMPVLFAMLIAAGAKLRHIILMVIIGASLMPAMYPLLQPHQKQRIVAMVSQLQGDTRHREGIGFQGYKAQLLVGAGQVTGHEPDYATSLVRFNALPEPQNDMIFAVICTRWGAGGGVAVIGLFLLIMVCGFGAAALTKDPFARLIAVGAVTIIFTQMFVTIGMTVGVLPITGMTLPFVSYGGSSLVATYALIGLIFNVAHRRPIIMARPAFEFDRPHDQPVQRHPYAQNV